MPYKITAQSRTSTCMLLPHTLIWLTVLIVVAHFTEETEGTQNFFDTLIFPYEAKAPQRILFAAFNRSQSE